MAYNHFSNVNTKVFILKYSQSTVVLIFSEKSEVRVAEEVRITYKITF